MGGAGWGAGSRAGLAELESFALHRPNGDRGDVCAEREARASNLLPLRVA